VNQGGRLSAEKPPTSTARDAAAIRKTIVPNEIGGRLTSGTQVAGESVVPFSSERFGAGVTASMQFRVLGPDCGSVPPNDLRRLFRGQRLTAARRTRLDQGARVLAMRGRRLVGLAAYERADRELRVYEFLVDAGPAGSSDEIAGGLVNALELACLAGGARRLVMLPRATTDTAVLARRGFRAIAEGSVGTWFEKTFA
jgi:hypothetical protein